MDELMIPEELDGKDAREGLAKTARDDEPRTDGVV
jgi:hypothetical protein